MQMLHVICIVLLTFASSAIAQTEPTYNIGLLHSTSSTGLQTGDAAQLACSTISNSPKYPFKFNCIHMPYPSSVWSSTTDVLCDALAQHDLVGFWGPVSSSKALLQATVGAVLKMPIVSPAATNNGLSDKSVYSSFFRVVSRDAILTGAMSALVTEYQWPRIGVIFSDDQSGIGAFNGLAASLPANVSIAAGQSVSGNNNATKALSLIKKTDVHVIVVFFMSSSRFPLLLQQIVDFGMTGSDYVWLFADTGIDGMDRSTPEIRKYFKGAIGMTPAIPDPKELTDIWIAQHGSAPTIKSYSYASYDAMFVFAEALKMSPVTPRPKEPNACFTGTAWADGDKLMNAMRSVSFEGLTGNVKFNAQQDRDADWAILNYVNNGWVNKAVFNPTDGMKPKRPDILWGDGTNIVPNGNPRLRNKHLRVATVAVEPFVRVDETKSGNARFSGFVIDVLQLVATELGFTYELYAYPGNIAYNDMLNALRGGQWDMAIADTISTSDRSNIVSLSMPYMFTGYGVMIKDPPGRPFKIFQYLEPFGPDLWATVAGVILTLAGLLYVFEGGQSEDYPKGRAGLGNSFYQAFCTFVVQRPFDVATPAGITIMTFSMFAFLIVYASYTANLASSLISGSTSDAVTGWKDIVDSRVELSKVGLTDHPLLQGYVTSTVGTEFYVCKSGIDECYDKLESGELAAVVTDMPYLAAAAVRDRCNLRTVGGEFARFGYTIAMPLGSLWTTDVDNYVIQANADGSLQNLWDWTIGNLTECSPNAPEPKAGQFGPNDLGGLIICFAVVAGAVVGTHVFVHRDEIFTKGRGAPAASEIEMGAKPSVGEASGKGPMESKPDTVHDAAGASKGATSDDEIIGQC